MPPVPRVGDLLVRSKMISSGQLEEALDHQKKKGGKVAEILMDMGVLKEEDFLRVLGLQLQVKVVRISAMSLDAKVIGLVPSEIRRRFGVVAFRLDGTNLHVAMGDPTDQVVLDVLKNATGCQIVPFLASDRAIREVLDRHDAREVREGIDWLIDQEEAAEVEAPRAGEDPMARVVNALLSDAMGKEASEIHIEPFEHELVVRYRIGGTLVGQEPLPRRAANAITGRFKEMFELAPSSGRAQDGRTRLSVGGKSVELVLATVPVAQGESLCVHILDRSYVTTELASLGFQEGALAAYLDGVGRRLGMVVVAGPRGSGKTTTLHSTVARLNAPELKICTVEDYPVEHERPGVLQVAVGLRDGMSYADAIEALLWQAPDILMVNQVRDAQTADKAVKAALSGCLVLCAIHAYDAASSMDRLYDLGVPPNLVAAAVNTIVAQRLLRTLCPECKRPVEDLEEVCGPLNVSPGFFHGATVYERGDGCGMCAEVGFKGRTGLFEVMPISRAMQRLLVAGGTTQQIRELAAGEGMMTLRADALQKMKWGLLDAREVLRETAMVH